LGDIRQHELKQWLKNCFKAEYIELSSLEGDAGFRRYFRFCHNDTAYIAVDAPIDYCNNEQFVYISNCLVDLGIKVPKIHFYDDKNGYFCLEDLGKTLLANVLTKETVESFYLRALTPLIHLAKADVSNSRLPTYDADFIKLELGIFKEWLLEKHLNMKLTDEEQSLIEKTNQLLVSSALEQPSVFMHRDYHCRNIMLTNQNELAVIDFQDAVKGPITYDVVSLLRDCYVKWPSRLVLEIFSSFCQQVSEALGLTVSNEQWQRWFDLMGMQRHIKASGIFARLHHRDYKSHYMKDIPLTLSYIVDVSNAYPELVAFGSFVESRVMPHFVCDKEQK